MHIGFNTQFFRLALPLPDVMTARAKKEGSDKASITCEASKEHGLHRMNLETIQSRPTEGKVLLIVLPS